VTQTVKTKKIWTLQNKLLTVCGAIAALSSAIAAVSAGGNKTNEVAEKYIEHVARPVAAHLDSIMLDKRFPIDSAILLSLREIRMEQKKVSFFQEQTCPGSEWRRAEAAWKNDSIRNAKYDPR
jgi:hypothetical protein